MVYALHKIFHYLLSKPFKFYTNHEPLKFLLNKRVIQERTYQFGNIKIGSFATFYFNVLNDYWHCLVYVIALLVLFLRSSSKGVASWHIL